MRTLLVAVLALAILPAAAHAADLPPELPGLEEEGKKWFDTAGNTDLSTQERNEARKKAWVAIYKAWEILDHHWDTYPADQDRIADRLEKAGQMKFWLHKESPVGLLESTGVGPKPKTPSPKPPAPKPAEPAPSEPPPPAPGSPPSKPPTAAPPGPAAPEAPAKPTIEEAYKEAEAYAKKHRMDKAGIMQRFHQLMADYADQTGHPLYQKAAEAAGKANANLKDVYRKFRNEDPDSLKNVDDDEVEKAVLALGRDLQSPDSAVRARAAGLLGSLGSGEAVFPLLAAATKETDEKLRQAEIDAVVAIGGSKAADQLAKLKGHKRMGPLSLDALKAMCAKNPVDKRLAVRQIGAYAILPDETLASAAVDFLVGLGKDGARGLRAAVFTENTEVRLKIIPALGQTGDPRCAKDLVKFLLGGDNPKTRACQKAAMDALKVLGEPAVPYMFAGLRDGETKQWTAELLRQMTEQRFGMKDIDRWKDWWKQGHPDWKEQPEDP
jgi:hypothetical protein